MELCCDGGVRARFLLLQHGRLLKLERFSQGSKARSETLARAGPHSITP